MRRSTTAARTARDARVRVFHGWKVVGASAAILAMHSAFVLQAFGLYAVVLREQFGWSKTTISIAYSFNRAESGLLGPLQGWALQRFGTKAVMRLGAVVLIAGFLWFSQIETPLGFIGSFFTIAVGAGLSGFMTVTTETVRWFEGMRARALSILGLGLAAGGLVVPMVVLALRQFGWRATAAGSGLVIGVIVLVLASIFGTSPADHGTFVDGTDPNGPQTDNRPVVSAADHLTASEAMRTPAFWLIALGHASSLLVVGSVIAHLSLYLTSEQGFSLQGASFVVGAIPLAQMTGMAIGGVFGDRVSKRLLCALAMLGHMTGLLLLTFADRTWMIWAFILLHGLAWGMRGPMMSAIRADYFGATHFAQIMGYSSVVLMVGMVGGPLFAGILADVTGSYRIGFTVLALLAGAGSLFFAAAKPPRSPSPSPQQ